MKRRPTRRTFFRHAGAALAVPLAAAAPAGTEAAEDIAARLAALEDANAVRALVSALLDDPRRLGLDARVRGLAAVREHTIAIAADGTATARLACNVETATPIEGGDTLVEMARLQGDGVVKRTGRGVLTGEFVKRDGAWELARAMLEVNA